MFFYTGERTVEPIEERRASSARKASLYSNRLSTSGLRQYPSIFSGTSSGNAGVYAAFAYMDARLSSDTHIEFAPQLHPKSISKSWFLTPSVIEESIVSLLE